GEAEISGDLGGKYRRLAGGDIQRAALRPQHAEQCLDAIEWSIFIQPGDLEALAVVVDRLPGGGLVQVIAAHEALQQRRADEMFQRGQVWLVDVQLGEG